MNIDIWYLIGVIVLAGLAYWVNEKLNMVPFLKNLIQVIIVVVAVILVLQSTGIMGNIHTNVSVH